MSDDNVELTSDAENVAIEQVSNIMLQVMRQLVKAHPCLKSSQFAATCAFQAGMLVSLYICGLAKFSWSDTEQGLKELLAAAENYLHTPRYKSIYEQANGTPRSSLN